MRANRDRDGFYKVTTMMEIKQLRAESPPDHAGEADMPPDCAVET